MFGGSISILQVYIYTYMYIYIYIYNQAFLVAHNKDVFFNDSVCWMFRKPHLCIFASSNPSHASMSSIKTIYNQGPALNNVFPYLSRQQCCLGVLPWGKWSGPFFSRSWCGLGISIFLLITRARSLAASDQCQHIIYIAKQFHEISPIVPFDPS